MADCPYQELQAVDEEITVGDSRDVDANVGHHPPQNARTPSMDVEDPRSGPRYQGSRSSETTISTSISVNIESRPHTPFPETESPHTCAPCQYPRNLEVGPSTNISVDIETCQHLTNVSRAPSPDDDDARAGSANQRSLRSEPTTPTNILTDEVDPAHDPGTTQQATPILSDPVTSISTVSQDQARHDDLSGGVQNRAPKESVAWHLQHPSWTMFYFRHLFLVPFSILLILTIAGLEVLYHMSQRNHGLMTASEGMHYAWTYGPTFGESDPTRLCLP